MLVCETASEDQINDDNFWFAISKIPIHRIIYTAVSPLLQMTRWAKKRSSENTDLSCCKSDEIKELLASEIKPKWLFLFWFGQNRILF